jgi:FAD/FMN-containing dehydrogenase
MSEVRLRSLSGEPVKISESAVGALQADLRTRLLQPGVEGYETARQVWNGMIDGRPSLIARCTGVADVMASVKFARDNQLLIAVRGGGHSVAGHSTCRDGFVIDLSLMNSVRVDPIKRTVRAGGGATWGDVDRETHIFATATPGGVVSTTGVAGLTLGGGYGWLRRKFGLSCDNLLSADLVTADGELITASRTENADLWWGLRGGGGNFGVVTSFEFQLHPAGPEVFYAATVYPAESASEVLHKWCDFVTASADEVTSDATLWTVLPDPQFPEEIHGRDILLVEGVYAGPAHQGERALDGLRRLEEPLEDLSGPLPYPALNMALDAVFPAGQWHCYWKSLYLEELGPEAVSSVVDWSSRRPSKSSLVPIRHLGGAMSRVPTAESALGDRSSPFLLSIDSTWEDPAATDENIAWTREFWRDMGRFSSGAIYFNFPGLLEEGETLLKNSFGANYEKLVDLKNKYDPGNLFRLNQNIKPSQE